MITIGRHRARRMTRLRRPDRRLKDERNEQSAYPNAANPSRSSIQPKGGRRNRVHRHGFECRRKHYNRVMNSTHPLSVITPGGSSRRRWLATASSLTSLAALGLLSPAALGQRRQPLVEVWKSPTCGCCNDWITHLQKNGFATKAYDEGNTAKRRAVGLPVGLGSCHTATVEGYVIEGHVPAAEIQRLLKERPKALGLSVPQMPIGSPGMDGPEYGGQKDTYDVLLVDRSGKSTPYARYHGGQRIG